MKRELSEARIGLLMRMLGLRSVVCPKRIQEPLLRRKYTKQINPSTYELTRAGRKFVNAELDARKERGQTHLITYPILCIGNVVGIVSDLPPAASASSENDSVVAARNTEKSLARERGDTQ